MIKYAAIAETQKNGDVPCGQEASPNARNPTRKRLRITRAFHLLSEFLLKLAISLTSTIANAILLIFMPNIENFPYPFLNLTHKCYHPDQIILRASETMFFLNMKATTTRSTQKPRIWVFCHHDNSLSTLTTSFTARSR